MRMDRLFQMVVLLINHKKLKAQELAEHFGVSVRTVYRDADTISLAGIPIISYPGLNGGLGIAEGFRLDRTVLSEAELTSVMLALQSASGLWSDKPGAAAREKLRAMLDGAVRNESGRDKLQERLDSLRVDHAPWNRPAGYAAELTLLRQGIEEARLIQFSYCSGGGQTGERLVEPYTLVMKSGQWYVYAFCRTRKDFRLFRLSRMRELELTESTYTKREIPSDTEPWKESWQQVGQQVELKLLLPAELRPLAEEWFGWGLIEERGVTVEGQTQSQLQITVSMPDNDQTTGYLLSFGDRLEVIGPGHIRQRLKEIALAIVARYS